MTSRACFSSKLRRHMTPTNVSSENCDTSLSISSDVSWLTRVPVNICGATAQGLAFGSAAGEGALAFGSLAPHQLSSVLGQGKGEGRRRDA